MPPEQPGQRFLIVQPNFDVLAYLDQADASSAGFLGRIAEGDSATSGPIRTFRITQTSVYQAQESGLSLAQIVEFFEQHSRRAKATSNICANVALCALMATIYLSTIGKQGLQRVGELSAAKAHYAAEQLTKVPGVSLRFAQPFFKEFTLALAKPPASIVAKLAKKRILPGVPLKTYDRTLADCLLVAVTEQRTREEIDAYAAALAEVLA